MGILRGAEPFLLPGGPRGVLLVHGFTGSPSEMRLLGDFLHAHQYTVLAPRLTGHGTTVEHMAKTTWRDWYGDVEDGYHLLKGICSEVSVVGLSMGGLLASLLSAEYPIAKLGTLSMPIYVADKRLPLLPAYRLLRNYVPKQQRRLKVDPIYTVNYDRTPLSSLASLLELIEHVKRVLPAIACPLLVVQSRVEHTVRPESADYIMQHAGSAAKKLVWLRRSGHIITLDIEKEQVFEAVLAFLEGRE